MNLIIGWNLGVLCETLAYGTAILYSLIKHWHDETKKEHRINELIYVLFFYIFGISSLFLFEGDNLSYEVENRYYMILFLTFLALDIFWWGLNLIPNLVKCKKHPELLEDRKYEDFVVYIKKHQAGSNIKGDITRKFLHVLMFGIVVGMFVYARANQAQIEIMWENYWAFSKFIYTLIAYGFVFMFSLADLMRHNLYHALPNWARKWFKTSIAPREAYTFISSIPYVITLSLFMFAPYQVLFVATAVSTFADAGASIVGKLIGKHKFPDHLDSKKSYEGLFAGCMMAFLSSTMLLILFPFPGQTDVFVLAIGSICTVIFACTDLFIQKIADNVTNVLIPGIFTWILALVFGFI